MRWATLLLSLACFLQAQDVPFYPTSTKDDRDIGAVNRNFSELAERGKDRTDTSLDTSITLTSKTKAEFDAEPGVVGKLLLCSNCSQPYTLCIGSSSATCGYTRVQTGTVDTSKHGCGTGE